ncbi:MAG: GAF domain-containing protein [Actinomycetota bacterium]|nr:GAF domain-containing protein [Actinomycetota bacterium]
MRATTIRFTEDLWQQLERESAAQGTSAAQLIRDATILRLAHLAGRRGDPEALATIEGLAARAVRAPRPVPELADEDRLAALRRTALLDRPSDPALDRIARLAQRLLRAPVALVSLIDRDRQFMTSCIGLPEPWASRRELPLSHSICQHAVVSREALVVGDARDHPELRDNLAITELGAVAYAGVPLVVEGGHALGTLCVADAEPRVWSGEDVATLRDLAASAVSELTLRLRAA